MDYELFCNVVVPKPSGVVRPPQSSIRMICFFLFILHEQCDEHQHRLARTWDDTLGKYLDAAGNISGRRFPQVVPILSSCPAASFCQRLWCKARPARIVEMSIRTPPKLWRTDSVDSLASSEVSQDPTESITESYTGYHP